MKTKDFYYDLPPKLIASEPLAQRSASRLLSLRRDGLIEHKQFTDLPDLLQDGDLLVFNDSKVIPARLYARKPTGGKVEILIERIVDDYTALAHVKGAKSLKAGTALTISTSDEDAPEIIIGERRGALLELKTDINWHDLLDQYGRIPLPPYMEREDRIEDRERYQTVYAKEEGSVAAPTAGLHFEDNILNELEEKGIRSSFATLHVGAGTFQPVRVEDTSQHKMHSERFEITQEIIDLIKQTKSAGGRIIAVGTTSVRVLESYFQNSENGNRGETDIFITPGYNFKIIDGMITNFHLPESTLLMLVSAFSGRENILDAYQEAIAQNYRFFSYGDAMLLT